MSKSFSRHIPNKEVSGQQCIVMFTLIGNASFKKLYQIRALNTHKYRLMTIFSPFFLLFFFFSSSSFFSLFLLDSCYLKIAKLYLYGFNLYSPKNQYGSLPIKAQFICFAFFFHIFFISVHYNCYIFWTLNLQISLLLEVCIIHFF